MPGLSNTVEHPISEVKMSSFKVTQNQEFHSKVVGKTRTIFLQYMVVYMSSKILELAVGSCDLSPAEKKVTVNAS